MHPALLTYAVQPVYKMRAFSQTATSVPKSVSTDSICLGTGSLIEITLSLNLHLHTKFTEWKKHSSCHGTKLSLSSYVLPMLLLRRHARRKSIGMGKMPWTSVSFSSFSPKIPAEDVLALKKPI